MPANAQTEDPFRATDKDRIRKFEGQNFATEEKIANCGRPLHSFDETIRTALDFLGNLNRLWASEHLEEKRIVLKLAFSDRLAYDRNEGLRTPTLAMPFKVLREISSGKKEMARPERFDIPIP